VGITESEANAKSVFQPKCSAVKPDAEEMSTRLNEPKEYRSVKWLALKGA
jgi:hypothetical protein